MAYQMAATTVTLNDLEGHSPLADVFKCSPSNICAAFYTISTECEFRLNGAQVGTVNGRQECTFCQKLLVLYCSIIVESVLIDFWLYCTQVH